MGVLTLAEFLKLTQLETKAYPNPGEMDISVGLTSLLPEAVDEARAYMSARRQAFQEGLAERLRGEMENLNNLQDRQLSFLEFELPNDPSLVGARRARKQERLRRIDEVFASYRSWVEETLTTEDSPFLRVAAVFFG